MASQTATASTQSAGYILLFERGKVIASFYCWAVLAIYTHNEPKHADEPTAISFQREHKQAFWISTNCPVDEVQRAVDDAIKEWKAARPKKLTVRQKKPGSASIRQRA